MIAAFAFILFILIVLFALFLHAIGAIISFIVSAPVLWLLGIGLFMTYQVFKKGGDN